MVVVFVLIVSQHLMAGDTNFRNVIIGERAYGLAGAYVSMANDSSGCYYNPAGLPYIERSSFSVSASIYSLETNTTNNAFIHLGVEGENAVSSELIPVPSTVATTKKLFDRLTVGFCAVVPELRKINIDSHLKVEGTTTTTHSLRRQLNDQLLFAGPSVGFKWSDRLAFGASLFYVQRTYNLSNTMAFNIPDSLKMSLSTADLSFTYNAIALLAGTRYSLIKEPERELNVGVTMRTRSIAISNDETLSWSAVDQNSVFFQPTCPEELKKDGVCTELQDVDILIGSKDGLKASTIIPWEMTTGVSYVKKRDWGISFDVIHYFGDDYYLAELPGTSVKLGEIYQKSYMVNASLGGEKYLSDTFVLRTGFYTNFSANTKSNVESTPNQDKLDIYGINLGLGFEAKNSTTILGFGYDFGSGITSRVFGESGTDPIIRDLSERRMSILLASSYYFD